MNVRGPPRWRNQWRGASLEPAEVVNLQCFCATGRDFLTACARSIPGVQNPAHALRRRDLGWGEAKRITELSGLPHAAGKRSSPGRIPLVEVVVVSDSAHLPPYPPALVPPLNSKLDAVVPSPVGREGGLAPPCRPGPVSGPQPPTPGGSQDCITRGIDEPRAIPNPFPTRATCLSLHLRRPRRYPEITGERGGTVLAAGGEYDARSSCVSRGD